jgi:hypothetical protein
MKAIHTRSGMGIVALLAVVVAFVGIGRVCVADAPAPVTLHWLDGAPPANSQGVSWGIPWPKGTVQKTDSFALTAADGASVPVQTWPLAYWPDGSIMWSGQSISAKPGLAGPFQIAVGAPAAPAAKIVCTQDAAGISIDTGVMTSRIPKQGSSLFESISIGDRKIAENGKLVLTLEDRSQFDSQKILRQEDFVSQIKTVTLEQQGPVRAVVKIEGNHKSTTGDRAFLPFTVRLYFNAGLDSIRMVHSFVFDGDDQKDFIKGLGLSFSVPMREEVINRHVRFGGDTGMWAEPVKPVVGRRDITYGNQGMVFPDQVAGKRIPNIDQYAAAQQQYIRDAAQWDDYKLTQVNPDGFTIEKRTQNKSSWLHVMDGHRALGSAFLGDVTGGMAVDVKKFWQKYPASFEIHGATTAAGQLTVWLWSPDAPAMDLRHYDVIGHGLDMAYEDWKQGWDSALGVANTSELTLRAVSGVPSDQELVDMSKGTSAPAMLVCSPQYYHSQRACGFWSLPDQSSAVRRGLETQLTNALDFYGKEVDFRSWYGFWDYGDMMRMYDETRHEWRYDIGGWAWNNTELLPDYWLWYSFLRTGKADIFRLAEAMTRDTSEVSVHHIGRFAPLGSRHNVNHWGDGAKQPRISECGLKRPYYFLSTDERVGDLMREQLTADFTYADVKRTDPRMPDNSGPYTSASFGTDWAAYCINWLTEYQRTGDTKWLDKIKAGMDSQVALARAPARLLGAGPYDPTTGKFMTQPGGRGGASGPTGFDLLFGTVEIMAEMELTVDDPKYWDAFHAYAATQTGQPLAYASYVLKDPQLGARVWQELAGGGRGGGMGANFSVPAHPLTGPEIPNALQEVPGRPEAAGDAHRLLILIESMEWANDYAPKQ